MERNKQSFVVPLYLTKGKKKSKNYWLTLSNYRNYQYHLSNALKRQFKEEIDISHLKPIYCPIRIEYTFYYPDIRLRDIDNNLGVISKFTLDALVEGGIIEDDNYTKVVEVRGRFGGVDRDNPRCEVALIELNQ